MFRVVLSSSALLLSSALFVLFVLVGCSEEGGGRSGGRDGDGDAFLVGVAEVRDGDSLQVSGEEVRLLGIDAPENGQECGGEGQGNRDDVWDCGEAAKEMLEAMVRGKEVRCSLLFRDTLERWLSRCSVAGKEGEGEGEGEGEREDLGEMMVMGGMAVAMGKEYRMLMRVAQGERRGIWGGCLEKPERWRKGRRSCWFR